MEKNKAIWTLVVFIITVVVLLLFVLPKYQQTLALNKELIQKQAKYNGQEVYYANIADIVKKIDQSQDALGKIDNALPSRFLFSPLVSFLQTKGADAGLAMQSVVFSQISAQTSDHALRTVTFRISAGGSYANFKKFLASLDESARLFQVNSISFSPITGAALLPSQKPVATQQMYNFQMEISTNTY